MSLPLFPKRLRPGDTIGLFCPAGPVRKPNDLEAGIRLLTSMGFHIKLQGATTKGHPYLADTDGARADNFLSLWHDPEVQAIMAIRGGFGCMRLMPRLDLSALSGQPKLVIGFSDVTALLQGIFVQTQVVSIHGPVLTSLGQQDEQTRRQFFSLITGDLSAPVQSPDLEVLRGGTGQGPLIGGNLTTLVHLIGTPWESPWSGSILLLEDTGESPYRLDRMLTQLAYSGKMAQLSGLLLGSFDPGHCDDKLELYRLQEQLWSRVLELTAEYHFPVWGNFPIGHLQSNLALPIGMVAKMDSSSGQLIFQERSVQFL